MMGTLSITDINIGRFGNKLIYLNNLFQVSKHFDLEAKWPVFEMSDMFQFSSSRTEPLQGAKVLDFKYLIENKQADLHSGDYCLGPCLGNLFFEYDTLSTHELFKFKEELTIPEQPSKKIGIHFRGNDFRAWEPKAILPSEYYLESINLILEECADEKEFFISTDDYGLSSVAEVGRYLKSKGQNLRFGNTDNAKSDFIELSHCDYMISSPSTFCIAASFCGTKDKKIINSKYWIDYMESKDDVFWIKLAKSGNKNYKNYKLI